MVEISDVLADEELKSKVAAIGAGILVIIAGFLVYNYFSKVGEESGILREEAAVIEEGIGKEEAGRKEAATEEEKVEKSSEETILEEQGEQTPKETPEKEGQVAGSETATTSWTANNYAQGDISGNQYTVKRGDTLWEIAEARYGSGFEWDKILEANKDSIGFLANGSQALIEIGQVLVLP